MHTTQDDSISHLATNEEARRAIQRKVDDYQRNIQHLRAEIHKLHSQMNALLPIAQLPDEVLCAVFAQVRAAEAEACTDSAPFHWINVTYVCSRWRTVALAAPLLWTEPVMTNLYWAKTMLNRSQNADISIKAKLEEEDNRQERVILQALRESFESVYAARIKHLSISNICCTIEHIVSGLPISAPRLETLRIICGQGDTIYSRGRLFIPPVVLAHTDNLWQLELGQIQVDWNSHLFNHLTHLKLSNIDRRSRKDAKGFFKVLEKLGPRLLSLDLYNFLPVEDDAGVFCSSPPIQFESLVSLTVLSELHQVETFFGSITIPATTAVDITGCNLSYRRSYTALLSLMARAHASNVRCRTFVVDRSANGGAIRFQLYVNPITESYSFYTEKAQWSLSATSAAGVPPGESKFVDEVCDSGVLSLETITHIHIDDAVLLPRTMVRMFREMPAVIFAKISRKHNEGNMYRRAFQQFQTTDTTGLIFPQLNTIYLDRMRFFPSNADPAPRGNPTPQGRGFDADFHSLESLLEQRFKRGAAVKLLSFNRCSGVEEADILRLRNMADNVCWDEEDEEDEDYVFSEEEDDDYDEDEDEDDSEEQEEEVKEEEDELEESEDEDTMY